MFLKEIEKGNDKTGIGICIYVIQLNAMLDAVNIAVRLQGTVNSDLLFSVFRTVIDLPVWLLFGG